MGAFAVTALADSKVSLSKLEWIGGGESDTGPLEGAAVEGMGTAGVEGSEPEASGLFGDELAGAEGAEIPDCGATSRCKFPATSGCGIPGDKGGLPACNTDSDWERLDIFVIVVKHDVVQTGNGVVGQNGD